MRIGEAMKRLRQMSEGASRTEKSALRQSVEDSFSKAMEQRQNVYTILHINGETVRFEFLGAARHPHLDSDSIRRRHIRVKIVHPVSDNKFDL